MPTALTQGAPAVDAALWEGRIRAHGHRVLVSLLALGLPPERAREIAQATWLRLMEQEAAGALAEVELPGLAIRQARFLALDAIRQDAAERRRLAGALEVDPASDDDEEIQRAAVEVHIAGCDECMAEVGREARLELTWPGSSTDRAGSPSWASARETFS